MPDHLLELLAPARDADIGIEAIKHGADAVYIGGPAYGARAAAGNRVEDIARLANFAHRFHARVFVTLNTIFDDSEIEPARKLAWELHAAGADAFIVQDMGLLEVDMPPLPLHASTQTDIRTAEKARFLQDVGFSQIVLARELTLDEIQRIRAATDPKRCRLEFFIHGALCVAFSGQCYISHAHTGRSANRGECAQACRLPYTLEDPQGRIVAYDKHLLSLKDNDQSANLSALIDAGIRAFKIEGRYKDMAYVKNATAHYRQLLDAIMAEQPQYAAASSGRSTHLFTPQPEKSFNRGSTDYFVNGREHSDIGAFDTPKFAGEAIGSVTRIGHDWFEIDGAVELHNGDGVSYQPASNKGSDKLSGMRINVAQGKRLFPNEMPDDLQKGMTLYRNRDQAFERALEKESAERRIGVMMSLTTSNKEESSRRSVRTTGISSGHGEPVEPQGLQLTLTDADGITTTVHCDAKIEMARDAEKALTTLRGNLAKLGNTDFIATEIDIAVPWFVPASLINGLRRDGIAALIAAREAMRPRPPRAIPVEPPVPYPEKELTYLANVLNQHARDFYRKHGVELIADAYEADTTPGEVSLMITRHCLRYSFNLCPKQARDWQLKGIKAEPMTLINGSERLTLRFDCRACEMHVVGKSKNRVIPLTPVGKAY
ncbi:putative peptidase [Georgfuchsia toluolica]|uniref:Peptidase n=1 Tax=Georgfuchsia toluolica TaxID=424218 RepID=A0A916NJ60_9PROT|nr:U32 family peptidase [Georgfuchsia toluolica]CAG4885358.1 putative peptidase [Georgfuchsia toluolica]